MHDLAIQIAVLSGAMLLCFAGPFVALRLLVRRKRMARAQRRSPIGKDLLRGPGHSLREQLEEATSDLAIDIVALMLWPLVALVAILAQGLFGGVQSMIHFAIVFALGVVLMEARAIRNLLKAALKLDRLKAGYDGELAVGQELDQLMRQGAFVFHDVPGDEFNIDHVVIAREGLFSVETKGFTKLKKGNGRADATVYFDGAILRYPTWSTAKPLEQAERQAEWLSKWLTSAVGEEVRAMPTLALPGWFVERSGRGRVKVFNGKELAGLLQSRGGRTLSEQQVRQVAHQIEQRCRTVAPKYNESTKAT